MIGLVLEGGGARGSYHVGAYKAILEEGIKINGVTGTSIGALNGAMIVQGDFDICVELWENISYSKVINGNDQIIEKLLDLKLSREDLTLLSSGIKKFIRERGFDISPFKNSLDRYIDEEKIRTSPVDFGIVTVNISDFKVEEVFKEDIPTGKIKDYLLASAYLPVFKSEKINGKLYLDGGFYDNLPFKMLENKGYTDLIIVRTNAMGLTRKISGEINTIIISPSDNIGATYEYNKNTAKKNMNLGYYDAKKVFKGLRGSKYYIESRLSEVEYLKKFIELERSKIIRIIELFHINRSFNERTILENIIPKLGSGLGLHKEFTYEDLYISLLERKAMEFNIEKFKIYKIEELEEIIRGSIARGNIENKKVDYKFIDKMLESFDLNNLFNKDEFIEKIGDIILS